MDARLLVLAALADDEFDGECFNGPSFMKTLEKLDPEAAAGTDTYARALAWLASHDTFHAAQIRSMGVTGLKEKRS